MTLKNRELSLLPIICHGIVIFLSRKLKSSSSSAWFRFLLQPFTFLSRSIDCLRAVFAFTLIYCIYRWTKGGGRGHLINDKSSFFHFVFMVIKKYILIAICTVVSCADSFADYATWTRATLRRLLLFLLSSKVGKAVCAVNSIRLRKLMIFMKRIFVDLSLMKTVSSTALYNPSTTIKLWTLRLSSDLGNLPH